MGYFRYRLNDYNEVFDTVLEWFSGYAYVGSPVSLRNFRCSNYKKEKAIKSGCSITDYHMDFLPDQ